MLSKISLFIFSAEHKDRIDETQSYTLDGIRNSLMRQEDSIIFGLVERAQFCYNEETYDPIAFAMEGFDGSLVEFMVKETEKIHAKVRLSNLSVFLEHFRSIAYTCLLVFD